MIIIINFVWDIVYHNYYEYFDFIELDHDARLLYMCKLSKYIISIDVYYFLSVNFMITYVVNEPVLPDR